MRFSHFFVDRPIFASVISIIAVIAGLISFFVLPVAQYPEIAPPTVVVRAQYPGANAQTVADTVAVRDAWAGLTKQARAHLTASALVRSAVAADARLATVEKRFDKRMRNNHVLSCVNG